MCGLGVQLKRLRAAAMLAAFLALLGACDTKNVGQPWPPPPAWVQVTLPTDMQGGTEAVWQVTWIGGTAPYTIQMNLGGGATENVPAGTAALSPFTHAFTMVNPSLEDGANYSYTVQVIDSNYMVSMASGTFFVGPTPNQPPLIESAVYNMATRTLTVTVSDPDDGEELWVSVTEVPGLGVDATGKYAAATGPFTADFVWNAEDLLAGGAGVTTVSVTDSQGGLQATTEVPVSVPAFPLAADTLYALPLQTRVATDEPVTVLVATGVPADPLQFVNGVGLTIESDAAKVPNSYDPGALGGGWSEADGFWGDMAPGGGFLLPPDNFIVATDIGGGRERWDFNVTPIDGSEATGASGALFSYQFTFSSAGTKTFGFQDVSGVKRTYYSDTAGNEYFWGDIANSAAPLVEVQ